MAGTEGVAVRVVAIIAAQAMMEPGQVQMAASLEDLGLNSLGQVEVIFAIEEAFDVTVPFNANDPAASGFDTSSVLAVIAAVQALVAARA